MKPHIWYARDVGAWACGQPILGSGLTMFVRVNLGSTPFLAWWTFVNYGWRACKTEQ